MADGYIVYQGLANQSSKYFTAHMHSALDTNKGRRFANPADIFMKKLSLSYPKTEEDERTVNKLVSLYKDYQAQAVKSEAREFTVPPLDAEKSRNMACFSI